MLGLFRQKLPKEFLETGELRLVHVSDTPRSTYKFLRKLIREAQPDVLIHTGDLVDDVKLKRRPELIDRYVEGVREISKVLTLVSRLVVVPGNEDDEKVLRETFGASVVKPGTVISVGGVRLALGHQSEEVANLDADLRLYGHNFSSIPHGLNGLRKVNLILLPSLRVFKLSYPLGTNAARGYRILPGM